MEKTDFIEIDLDRRRRLALPLGSLKRAQVEINKARQRDGLEPHSIFWVIQETLRALERQELDVEVLLILIWAALIYDDPGLTLAQAEAMNIRLFDCTDKLVKCINIWLHSPAPAADQAEDDTASPPLPQSTGSISGPSAASTSG